jgi:hypothetical protein
MKQFVVTLTVLLGLSWGVLRAQDQDFRRSSPTQSEYLIGSDLKVSGFGGPFVEIGSMANKFSVMTGGGGAVLFNRAFFIGGFGQGLSNDIYYNIPFEGRRERMKLEVGMGGIWAGYSVPATKVVHFIGQAKLGFGSAQLSPDDKNIITGDNYAQENFVALCPQAGMEVNFAPWFRLSIEGGYRYFSGGDLPFVDNLSGAYGALTLRFGWFE